MFNVLVILETYEWLICWLATSTLKKMDDLKNHLSDKFLIKNQSQVFKARSLSLVFAEVIILTIICLYNVIVEPFQLSMLTVNCICFKTYFALYPSLGCVQIY